MLGIGVVVVVAVVCVSVVIVELVAEVLAVAAAGRVVVSIRNNVGSLGSARDQNRTLL